MPIARVSLVPQLDNRSSSLSKDARLVNGYAEEVSKELVKVVKRPGYDAGTLYEVGAIQGAVNYLGVARVIVNDKFFKTSSTSVAVSTGGLDVDFA